MSISESKKNKKPCRYSARNVLVQIFTVCGWMQVRLEKNAVPGQFVSLYSRNGGKLLQDPSVSVRSIKQKEN